jgi:hypothetical protein
MFQAVGDERARYQRAKPFVLMTLSGQDVDVVVPTPRKGRIAHADDDILMYGAEAEAVLLEISS